MNLLKSDLEGRKFIFARDLLWERWRRARESPIARKSEITNKRCEWWLIDVDESSRRDGCSLDLCDPADRWRRSSNERYTVAISSGHCISFTSLGRSDGLVSRNAIFYKTLQEIRYTLHEGSFPRGSLRDSVKLTKWLSTRLSWGSCRVAILQVTSRKSLSWLAFRQKVPHLLNLINYGPSSL